ncbi:MAG: Flp pilus assembly complex ATPase component TadA [Candidatus Riflebacteria bacterium]|nr:Flp pilus assembly complex ATPase component TadA [Candidatus Riflebacteria bacterium]
MARSLLDNGILAPADLRRALEYSASENVSFQASLFKLNLVKPEALARLVRTDAKPAADPSPPAATQGQPPIVPSHSGTSPTAAALAQAAATATRSDTMPTGTIRVPGPDKEETPKRKRLGELLVDESVITEQQLGDAVKFASEKNILLGTALVSLGFITEQQLSEHMARHSAEVKKQAAKTRRLRLGDLLLEQKTITPEQLTAALDYSKTHKRRLGEALVEMGTVKDRDIAMALSKQMALPYVNLAKTPPDVTLFQKIPKRMCLKNQLLPFRLEGKVLTVAIVDPLNVLALDDIQNITGFTVLPVIITKSDFDTAAKNFLGEEDELMGMLESPSAEVSGQFETGFNEEATPIVNLINKVIGVAVAKGASDVHIDPCEKELRIRFRIDGVLTDVMQPPIEAAAAIVSRIKVMCSLDIAENRLPQDGKFRMKVDNKVIDFRVAVLPVIWGEKVVIRLLDQSRSSVAMEDLGLEKKALEDLRWGIHMPNGIVLVTGPTGSGKSTTLYSALHELQDPKVNIHTAEDPVEFSVRTRSSSRSTGSPRSRSSPTSGSPSLQCCGPSCARTRTSSCWERSVTWTAPRSPSRQR